MILLCQFIPIYNYCILSIRIGNNVFMVFEKKTIRIPIH